jgi:hypothetical protein
MEKTSSIADSLSVNEGIPHLWNPKFGWRTLYNEQLHNVYPAIYITRKVK